MIFGRISRGPEDLTSSAGVRIFLYSSLSIITPKVLRSLPSLNCNNYEKNERATLVGREKPEASEGRWWRPSVTLWKLLGRVAGVHRGEVHNSLVYGSYQGDPRSDVTLPQWDHRLREIPTTDWVRASYPNRGTWVVTDLINAASRSLLSNALESK